MSFSASNLSEIEYFDITVSSLNTSSLNSNPILQFNESRSKPFVYNPSEYFFYIVRFSLDTNSLPIFVPSIQASQSDSNLTIYSISMSYDNTTVQTYMKFIPQDQTQGIPSAPIKNNYGLQVFDNYYYVYNYEYVIYLVNNTLKSCFDSLTSSYSGTLPTTNIPYLKWDSVNRIATLITDNAGFNDSSDNYISLFFNNALYQLFPSLPSKIINSTSSLGLNYLISCSCYGIATTETILGYTSFNCIQEYSTVSNWNPVLSIVFTSNTLPMVAEQISAPIVYINNLTVHSTNTSNIANIISDFESNDGIYKPFIIYQPYIFRYKQLIGNAPLYNIDIQCYWKNRYGNLIPFYLNSGGSGNLKLAFIRKQ